MSQISGSGAEFCFPGLPGGRDELERDFDRHGVTEKGRSVLLEALTGDPVRRVESGRNVCVLVASRKMRRRIQAESKSIELPFIERCENDPSVKLYLCQPAAIRVGIQDKLNRKRKIRHVPDFLVLDGDGFAFWECKPTDKLERDAASAYPRFIRDDRGWRFPAAELAAKELGFKYRVFPSGVINPVWHRNIRYLHYYIGRDCDDPDLAQAVIDELSKVGSMRVQEALTLVGEQSDVLWWLVANYKVWADYQFEVVFEDTSSIYASEARMIAGRSCGRGPVVGAALSARASFVEIEPGAEFQWDKVDYTVVHRGVSELVIRQKGKGQTAEISIADFENYLRRGVIRGDLCGAKDSLLGTSRSLIAKMSNEGIEEANRRYAALLMFRATGKVPEGSSARSLRRYAKFAKKAEEEVGFEYLGLLRRRGRRIGTSGLDPEQEEMLEEAVEAYANDENAGSLISAYERMVSVCFEKGIEPPSIEPPSYETLRRRVKERLERKLARKREGGRSVYQKSGPRRLGDELEQISDRAFEYVYVDHTKSDIELVSRRTGANLGRAWMSLFIDDFTRMPLAMVVTYAPPSRATCAALIMDCVSRYNRLPENLVVDKGSEFYSKFFENILPALRINKVERGATQPRQGAIIERVFGDVNTRLIHQAPGNTKLNKQGRNLSASHDPRGLASWSIMFFHDVCERFFFEVYPELDHKELGTTRRQVLKHSLTYGGARNGQRVTITQDLRMLLAMEPDDGPTRKVDPVRGISVENLRFWHEDFGLGKVVGSSVAVKMDPLDCSVVYAWVNGRWVTCELAGGGVHLRGLTWKAKRLVLEEMREQRHGSSKRLVSNAKKMGDFVREVDRESELGLWLERDAETRSIHLPDSVRTDPANDRLPNDKHESLAAADPRGEAAPLPPKVPKAPDGDDALEGVEAYEVTY